MANYDAEATGRLLFIFIKDFAEKHGVTNLAKLNVDLISPDSYKKGTGQTRNHLCQEPDRLEKHVQIGLSFQYSIF